MWLASPTPSFDNSPEISPEKRMQFLVYVLLAVFAMLQLVSLPAVEAFLFPPMGGCGGGCGGCGK